MRELTKYKIAMESWITDQKPSHWVTFNFNRAETKDGSIKRLKEFNARLDRKLFGRNWAKKEDRPVWIWFMEHENSNLHWHSYVKLDWEHWDTFETHAEDIWTKIVEPGSLHIALYEQRLFDKARGYATKEWTDMSRTQDFVLSSEFKT